MKHLLTYLLLFILLTDCKKNHDAPEENPIPLLNSLQNHIWIYDSAHVVTATETNTVGQVTGIVQYLTFKNNILTEGYGSISTQYKTEFQEPNTLFFWYPQSIKDTGMYLLINSVTDTKLVTSKHFGPGETTSNYYHAE